MCADRGRAVTAGAPPAASGTVPTVLVLVRHGATTPPTEASRFGGASEDPPLTEAGLAHARALAAAWAPWPHARPVLWCSPKQRSRATLAPLASLWQRRPKVSAALDELDYGAWADRTREEVAHAHGPTALAAWDERGEAPAAAGFRPPTAVADAELRAWTCEAAALGPLALAVSHNGRLRSAHALPGRPEGPRRKLRCGAAGIVWRADAASPWQLAAWDVTADEAVAWLARAVARYPVLR